MNGTSTRPEEIAKALRWMAEEYPNLRLSFGLATAVALVDEESHWAIQERLHERLEVTFPGMFDKWGGLVDRRPSDPRPEDREPKPEEEA